MIETYWDEVFGEFKTSTGKFEIPNLPEPLMSAHFGVTNIVGAEPTTFIQKFTLCYFTARTHILKSGIQKHSLNEANLDPRFWDVQKRLNTGAFDFIQRLVPFLLSLKTPHHHFFLEEDGVILATAIVGEASCGCFLFNLVIDEKIRKQGRGHEITKFIQNSFPEKATFYWTKYSWFTSDAETTSLTLTICLFRDSGLIGLTLESF